jgi:AcrR family transcriptional regulator/predicted acylesterase/phospholipase RssA
MGQHRDGVVIAGAGARGARTRPARWPPCCPPRSSRQPPERPRRDQRRRHQRRAARRHAHEPPDVAAAALTDFWRDLRCHDIWRPLLRSAPGTIARYSAEFLGMPRPRLVALLDTAPLLKTTARRWQAGGRARTRQRPRGLVRALAVATTDVYRGRTVVFVDLADGEELPPTDTRRAIDYVRTPVTIEHVLASAAIPVAFPAIALPHPAGERWYADGGVRLNTPLKPAIALGAERLVVVATHPEDPVDPDEPAPDDLQPEVDDHLVNILDTVLVDRMVEDLKTLRTVNRALHQAGSSRAPGTPPASTSPSPPSACARSPTCSSDPSDATPSGSWPARCSPRCRARAAPAEELRSRPRPDPAAAGQRRRPARRRPAELPVLPPGVRRGRRRPRRRRRGGPSRHTGTGCPGRGDRRRRAALDSGVSRRHDFRTSLGVSEQRSETRRRPPMSRAQAPTGPAARPGPPDRVAVRRQATRELIVAAAWDLARETGLTGFTLRQLAERVGMRAPSLYEYFTGKDAIYDAMFAQGNRAFLAMARTIAADGRRPPTGPVRVTRTGRDRGPRAADRRRRRLPRLRHRGPRPLPAAVPARGRRAGSPPRGVRAGRRGLRGAAGGLRLLRGDRPACARPVDRADERPRAPAAGERPRRPSLARPGRRRRRPVPAPPRPEDLTDGDRRRPWERAPPGRDDDGPVHDGVVDAATIPPIGREEMVGLATTEYDRILTLLRDLDAGDWRSSDRLRGLDGARHGRPPARRRGGERVAGGERPAGGARRPADARDERPLVDGINEVQIDDRRDSPRPS